MLVLFLILLAILGLPLFLVISIATLLGYSSFGLPLSSLFIEVNQLATNPVLMAIPLFTFAGYIMSESNTPRRLVNVAKALIGWMPGGLAVVSLITCAFFTAFTGASGVTIVAMGGLLFPVLLKEGYKENFTLGLLTTTGSLGLLFPPSLPLILYAVFAGSAYSVLSTDLVMSVDKLFLGALVPGLLIIFALIIYTVFFTDKKLIQRQKFSFKHLFTCLNEAKYEVPLPIIVLFGIYSGYFTASEAASITAFYVIVAEFLIYKDLSFKKDFVRIVKESMILVGGILLIIGMALAFTNFLVEADVPHTLVTYMKEYISGPIAFLMVLNIFLLIVGCMMDIFSAILVVVPLIVPISFEYGIHPIHLGVIFLTNLEIGYSTPPVGLNLFISSFRFKKSVLQVYKASIPYLIILIICLLLITYIPYLSTMFL